MTNLKSRLAESMRLSRLGGPWAEIKSSSSASPSLESWYGSNSGKLSSACLSQAKGGLP